jgi:hypothetical protein
MLFIRPTVFHGKHWMTLKQFSNAEEATAYDEWKENWYTLLRPALFLAVREMDEILWISLYKPRDCSAFESGLYNHLITNIRNEIEKDLLDGDTLRQTMWRGDEDWPEEEWEDAAGDDLEMYVPESMISPDNTEEQATDNMLLQEIKDYLDDEEWLILTVEYGEDESLAETLGISVNALNTRRNRIRKRVLVLFEE